MICDFQEIFLRGQAGRIGGKCHARLGGAMGAGDCRFSDTPGGLGIFSNNPMSVKWQEDHLQVRVVQRRLMSERAEKKAARFVKREDRDENLVISPT